MKFEEHSKQEGIKFFKNNALTKIIDLSHLTFLHKLCVSFQNHLQQESQQYANVLLFSWSLHDTETIPLLLS